MSVDPCPYHPMAGKKKNKLPLCLSRQFLALSCCLHQVQSLGESQDAQKSWSIAADLRTSCCEEVKTRELCPWAIGQLIPRNPDVLLPAGLLNFDSVCQLFVQLDTTVCLAPMQSPPARKPALLVELKCAQSS